MNKHTPGPWKILKGHTGSTWFVCYHTRKIDGKVVQRTEAAHVYKGPRLVKNHEEEGDAIASIDSIPINYRANKDSNEAEALANARLISAAPDLLAALERAYLQIAAFLNEGDFKRHVVFDAGYIVDALDKAKGKDDE
jgi:hypothetical protein